mmetsp:Transcript_7109/g.10175  ORF Transcript_7109/g.10175 Transcript_7109/m.10175 type:complete len:90 (-) Transcript_7109:736-1005(-)
METEKRNVTNPKTIIMAPLKKCHGKKEKKCNDKSNRTSISWTNKFEARCFKRNSTSTNLRRLMLLIFALVAIVTIIVGLTVTQSSSKGE